MTKETPSEEKSFTNNKEREEKDEIKVGQVV